MTEKWLKIKREGGSKRNLSNDLSHMQLILSLQQLKSSLLSSPPADETSVEGGGFFKEISSVYLSLPDIRSEPQRQPLETRPGRVYSALKKVICNL